MDELPIINNFRIRCSFCGEWLDKENDNCIDGVWCDTCDGFTSFEAEGRNQYTLLLEDNNAVESYANKPAIRFSQRLSPLRYPGGKSKLIPTIYKQIECKAVRRFVEPFAGGASVGLSLLETGVVQELILNDLDFGIYSLFETILKDVDWLIDEIETLDLSHDDFYHHRSIVKHKYKGCSQREAALSMLITNRLAYSGICKANSMGGKHGTKEMLLSRWNPKELVKRIKKIHSMRDCITVLNKDALEVIEEYYWDDKTAILCDAPYFLKGEQLYNHYYLNNDHQNLSALLESLFQGMPGAHMIVTYDEHEFIRKLYNYPNVEVLGRNYSI